MHMNYVKEEDGWIFGECSECNMIMKFRKILCDMKLKWELIFLKKMFNVFVGLCISLLHMHLLRKKKIILQD